MEHDFSEFFRRYEAVVAEAEAVFKNVQSEHPECVTCGKGCSDCCYALFDLSLIEAMYLKHKLENTVDGQTRARVLERADQAERENYKLKRQVFKASQEGRSAREILEQVAQMRIRCPLLNEEDQCDLYEHRPVTCRLYGIPMAIGGQAHTCGKSAFDPGKQYPTANMEALQDRLMMLSQEMVAGLNTGHANLGDVLVPVAMALMNEYDDEYLGIRDDDSATWVMGTDGSVTREESPCKSCASRGSCDQEGSGTCDAPQGGGN